VEESGSFSKKRGARPAGTEKPLLFGTVIARPLGRGNPERHGTIRRAALDRHAAKRRLAMTKQV
jgi:hypothetical protein